jgi:hypothetical protein
MSTFSSWLKHFEEENELLSIEPSSVCRDISDA